MLVVANVSIQFSVTFYVIMHYNLLYNAMLCSALPLRYCSETGFIELATDTDRLEEYRRISAFNRKCGVDVQELTPAQVLEKFPLCEVKDILAGFYVADNGRVVSEGTAVSVECCSMCVSVCVCLCVCVCARYFFSISE